MGGRAFGSRYVLGELIGKGGMGRVYRASVRDGGPDVAVKLLRDDLASVPDVVSRFVLERDLLRAITHPQVVRVRDLVVESDDLGIVMDLFGSGNLRTVKPPPQALNELLPVMVQVAQGLAAVHAAGVVHRDVKPENILAEVGPDGTARIRLTDFGISRLMGNTSTHLTSVIGTPGYIAPEVALGGSAGAAADVYAFGVLMYEWATGRQPFAAENPVAMLRAHAQDAVPRPTEIPDPLWQLIESMLAKRPEQRPSSSELAERLLQLTPSRFQAASTVPMARAAPLPLRAPAPGLLAHDAATVVRVPAAHRPPSALPDLEVVAPPSRRVAARPGWVTLAAVAVGAAIALPVGWFSFGRGADQGTAATSAGSAAAASGAVRAPSAAASAIGSTPVASMPGSAASAPGAPVLVAPPTHVGPRASVTRAPGTSSGPSGVPSAPVPTSPVGVVQRPSAVSSMSLSGATASTLDLAWGAATGATSYRLSWSESGADGRSWSSDDSEYGAGRRGVTLIGLRAGRTYTVVVTPLNAAGAGPATTRTAATTP